MAEVTLSLTDPKDYQKFLAIRRLPRYRFIGRTATIPDEYAHLIGLAPVGYSTSVYTPSSFLFDYQADISQIAIHKERFAIFADCGLGKTFCIFEFADHAHMATGKPVLIISPIMVIPQTIAERQRWYPNSPPIQQVRAADLPRWLAEGTGIAITNYEALKKDLDGSRLGGLILDESSILKSSYGTWGVSCVNLGRGVRFKLACTGTPAPNDRIEFALHAVFLDQCRTVNEFLARYFVNRGQTDNRWELKPHALKPFYRSLSHWSIFLTDPSVYGWKDNSEPLPPINVYIHDVPLTDEQRQAVGNLTGQLVVTQMGGITSRAKLSQLAKGMISKRQIASNKPAFIQSLVESWPDQSTIIWCIYNHEQDAMAKLFPGCANIAGATKHNDRVELIDDFKARRRTPLVSKGKILGFGLNLQVATRQIFSGVNDSYETYYQCVKRSNRYGSTEPLEVHLPVTEIEAPMAENTLRKAKMIERDTKEQEQFFKESGVYGR